MHIPDGFLSTPVWATLDAVAVPAVGYLARRAQTKVSESRIPLYGVLGAFVFAAQMINFPVGVGTSGHLVGGALLAFTLGPAAASIVMTAILAIQALVFQDGGILALGANICNMAILGVLAGYLPYSFWGQGRFRRIAIFLGASLSVLVSACLALAQLLASGVSMQGSVLGLSLGLFVVSGLIEGAITLSVIEALGRLNPAWIRNPEGEGRFGVGLVAAGAIVLAAVGVLFASSAPDGLERLAEQIGIAAQAKSFLSTPLSDYEWKAAGPEWLRKAGPGLMGLVIVYAAVALFGRWATARKAIEKPLAAPVTVERAG